MKYISIKMDTVKNLDEKIERIPKILDRRIGLLANDLVVKLREAAPRGVTGNMKGRGTFEQKTKKGWVIKMPYYTPFLEGGVDAHPVGKSWKVDAWARMKMPRKGYGSGWNLPFILRRSIMNKGTKAHPFTNDIITEFVEGKLPKQLNEEVRKRLEVKTYGE